jgi:aspartate/methionine/tyrosine aminotransferase
VPTTTEDGRLRFSMEPFTKALPRAKLLVLADPANPTGGTFAPEDLEQIAWWANKYDVLIYCDETFDRFRYEGEPASVASFAPARRRTLVAGSVSVGHGLPAARVGWLAGNRYLLRPCAATAARGCPFLPTAPQQAALAALRKGDGSFTATRDAFAAKRQYAHERLRGLGLEPAWPTGGVFLWVPVTPLGLTGRAFAERLYAERRVLVSPGDLYGPGAEGHVRISYAADDGRLREGLGRLAEFVTQLSRPAQAPTPSDSLPETPAEPIAVGG